MFLYFSLFLRYGVVVNVVFLKEGDIYVMGGLINSLIVKGDLWFIEVGGNMFCYLLVIIVEGLGFRVGYVSLFVGNVFIVFGGDIKIEEIDVFDEILYFFNICEVCSFIRLVLLC